jgi:hypothetical protein
MNLRRISASIWAEIPHTQEIPCSFPQIRELPAHCGKWDGGDRFDNDCVRHHLKIVVLLILLLNFSCGPHRGGKALTSFDIGLPFAETM